MKRDALSIRYVPLADLVPYDRNARTHSEAQLEQLAASITEFGFTNPVLIDAENRVLAGHGRIAAARRLGLTEVPCVELAGMSDAQRRAYVLADNKLAENAGWDVDLLKLELAELRSAGFDLALTGFAKGELDELIGLSLDGGGLTDPDDAPALQKEAVTARGDTWLLGPHRVRCGDSTDLAELEALMAGERADAAWTDPPYNVAYSTKAGKIANDDLSEEQFLQFLTAAFTSFAAWMKPGASIYVAHADGKPGEAFRAAFRQAGFHLAGCLIWRKDRFTLSRSDYQWTHEPILYGWREGGRHRWYGGRKQSTVAQAASALDSPIEQLEDGRWRIVVGDQVLVVSGDAQLQASPSSVLHVEKPARSADHPTMKPVALIDRMLQNSARSGDIVLDLFGGSGSTLIAAQRLGMRARLMELSPGYCDVIVRRWQDFTGQVAVHEASGASFEDVAAARLRRAA